MSANNGKKYTTVIIDAGDGVGGGFVPLSDEIVDVLGLKESDTVELAVENGCIVITKPNETD